jgi:hypothetical protein
VRDPEHVRVREEAAVRVVGKGAAVEVQSRARDERPAFALLAEAHVLDLHERDDREGIVQREDVDVAGRDARHRERGGRGEDLGGRGEVGLLRPVGA